MKTHNFKSDICWICSKRKGITGEHFLKNTDLESCFYKTGEKKPIIKTDLLTDSVRTIHSTESKTFTFFNKICHKCNSEITQPYDIAWEVCSNYFLRNYNRIKRKKSFFPKAVFKNDSELSMLKVHLYFLKILVGHTVDNGYKGINMTHISSCLKYQHSNKYFFLKFGIKKHYLRAPEYAMKYPLKTLNKNVWASTVYDIGPLSLDLIFCTDYKKGSNLLNNGYWHPDYSKSNKILVEVRDF